MPAHSYRTLRSSPTSPLLSRAHTLTDSPLAPWPSVPEPASHPHHRGAASAGPALADPPQRTFPILAKPTIASETPAGTPETDFPISTIPPAACHVAPAPHIPPPALARYLPGPHLLPLALALVPAMPRLPLPFAPIAPAYPLLRPSSP